MVVWALFASVIQIRVEKWGRRAATATNSTLVYTRKSFELLLLITWLIYPIKSPCKKGEKGRSRFYTIYILLHFSLLIRWFAQTHTHIHIHLHARTIKSLNEGNIPWLTLCDAICHFQLFNRASYSFHFTHRVSISMLLSFLLAFAKLYSAFLFIAHHDFAYHPLCRSKLSQRFSEKEKRHTENEEKV